MIFENDAFYGVDIYADINLTVPVDTYMSLADADSYDLEETAKRSGVILNDDLGGSVEFDAKYCPQPTLPIAEGGGPNPAWESIVYVYLWWGSTEYYYGAEAAGGPDFVQDEKTFTIIKHDNDMHI
jgi:hypothetical protein